MKGNDAQGQITGVTPGAAQESGRISNFDLIKFALTGMVLLLAAMSLGIYLTMST